MSAAPELQGSDVLLEKKLDNLNLEKRTDGLEVTGSPDTPLSSITPPPGEKLSGPLKTPILEPVETAKPDPAVELTADQNTKYESLLGTVKSWTEVPSSQGKGGPITEAEIMWLTRECLLRYLRATKWVTDEAAKRLLGTLTWRREYLADLTADHVSPENETGKQIILGFDIAARPCHYLNPGRQNTQLSPRQNQHLVFMLERVIDLMVPGQETLSLLINFKSSKSRSNTAPGLGQGREVLHILQTHYPERLGRALIINIPWIVNGFFKLITPFIDPLTRQKLKFNDDMRQHVPPQQLWNEFHGDLEFEYDHDIYWPALLKLCEEKQAANHERWVKAGKNYGESEIYIKGGDKPSVSASSLASDAITAAVPSEKIKETVPAQEATASNEGDQKLAPVEHAQPDTVSSTPVAQSEKVVPVEAVNDSIENKPLS